jgi:hypothetical protein
MDHTTLWGILGQRGVFAGQKHPDDEFLLICVEKAVPFENVPNVLVLDFVEELAEVEFCDIDAIEIPPIREYVHNRIVRTFVIAVGVSVGT